MRRNPVTVKRILKKNKKKRLYWITCAFKDNQQTESQYFCDCDVFLSDYLDAVLMRLMKSHELKGWVEWKHCQMLLKLFMLTSLDRFETQFIVFILGSILLQPILNEAGRDISHWFDAKTGDVRHHIDPVTNCYVPYTPFGRFVHIPPPYPTTDWATDFGIPWWKDERLIVGYLTKKTRFVRIFNTLALLQHEIEVCFLFCKLL